MSKASGLELPRKVIQITAMPCADNNHSFHDTILYALCDDGTMWKKHGGQDTWIQLPPIPKDGAE